jgi:ribosomal protein S18 acetylase RimI-like enzyme
MKIHSLGYRTDLFFPQFEGLILDRGEYLVILTPSNPNFYWGNFLLFSAPPARGDLERWQALFQQEISSRQETHHMVFAWDTTDGETGDVQPFLEAGFELSQNVVLTAQQVHLPPKYNREVAVRPLVEDWEWAQALQNQVDCRPAGHSLEGYLTFKTAKMKHYRDMQRAGLGDWFGAFLGDRLVADLGLFCIDGIGRFQSVETAPEFRRRGICGALVYGAARYGLERMGAKTLVMLADENYFAARIYESIGFQAAERQAGLEWWEKI